MDLPSEASQPVRKIAGGAAPAPLYSIQLAKRGLTPDRQARRRAHLGDSYQVYGLIYDIHIDDDGLVRQLVTADNVSEEVLRDNRERRIVPVEMSVMAVGYEQAGKIYHMLPPRPPLRHPVVRPATYATCSTRCSPLAVPW